MAERFLCSEPEVGDISFADVESILDALEAGLVSSADTPLFDSARQSWQPVGLHPEVRSAWEVRERYRPPGGSQLTLPGVARPECRSRSMTWPSAAPPTPGSAAGDPVRERR